MKQGVLLGLAALVVFAGIVAGMVLFMPPPLQSSDYFVIGSVATLVSMLIVFLGLVSTKLKTRDTFFKRRRKPQ